MVNRSPNMFTLIGLGTGAAYLESVVATLLPQIFPASFRDMDGAVSTYFEAAAVITTLVLLGQVLELRARQQTEQRDSLTAESRAEASAPFRATARSKMSRSNMLNRATGSACVQEKVFR